MLLYFTVNLVVKCSTRTSRPSATWLILQKITNRWTESFFKKNQTQQHFTSPVGNAIRTLLQCLPFKDLMALSAEWEQCTFTRIKWHNQQENASELKATIKGTFVGCSEGLQVSEVSLFATTDSFKCWKMNAWGHYCFPVRYSWFSADVCLYPGCILLNRCSDYFKNMFQFT